jgi:hypothetical protein
MRFPYAVNHNGKYYKAGEEIPIENGQDKFNKKQQPKRGRPPKTEE